MIILYGSRGYIGSKFAEYFDQNGIDYFIRSHHHVPPIFPRNAKLVINCAAFIPPNSVAECDEKISKTLSGNVMLPSALARACSQSDIPLMTFSTGCLWNDDEMHSEDDPPQRGFGGHCGIYVGTKLLAEKCVQQTNPKHYILRIRLPFDHVSCRRNFLTKMATYPVVHDNVNSLSRREDIVDSAMELWSKRAPFGTYHVANEGTISTREIIEKMLSLGIIKKAPEFITGPTKGTRLNVSKLEGVVGDLMTAEEAVDDALENWEEEKT